MYTVDIVVMYFIMLYIFIFKNQSGVFWKSVEEYLDIFRLRYHLLHLTC